MSTKQVCDTKEKYERIKSNFNKIKGMTGKEFDDLKADISYYFAVEEDRFWTNLKLKGTILDGISWLDWEDLNWALYESSKRDFLKETLENSYHGLHDFCDEVYRERKGSEEPESEGEDVQFWENKGCIVSEL